MLVAGFGFGFGFGSTLSITSLQKFPCHTLTRVEKIQLKQTEVVVAQVGTCAHLALSITCNFLPCD